MKSILLQSVTAMLLTTLLINCSPERKLKRAERKLANLIIDFPKLVYSDTIYSTDTLRIPTKEISGEINLDKRYEKLDSLFALYAKDTSVNKSITTSTIKNYIINKPILLDTIFIDTIGIHFKLFEVKGKLNYLIKIDEQELIKKYKTVVNTVSPIKYVNAPTKWWQWILYVIAGLAVAFIALNIWSSRK